jgi:hypothetical protein
MPLVFAVGCFTLSARDIKGVVLADNDSTAVIGALCELKVSDSAVAKSVTDQNGAFVIDDTEKAASDLVISMPGYSSTEIFIPAGAKSIDFGTIYLSGNVQLGELTVTAQQVTHGKQGRTIVIPSSAEVKASTTSLSLFQKLPLPGLNVDEISRKISVDGGSPVILIDGVPSTIDQFNAIQAKDIERVEYSRVTPARYADKGNSGFVNVVLKQRTDGGSAYAWLRGCPATCFFDGTVNASYHQGASQFSLYYTPSWRNYQSVYDYENSSYIGDDFRVDLQSYDRNPFNYFTNQLSAQYTYRPDNATILSATFNLGTDSEANRTIGSISDSQLGTYDTNYKNTFKQLTPSLDLFLRRDFDDKNSIEVEVVGTLSSNDYKRTNVYTYTDGAADTYQNAVENRRRSLISEISYNHDFSAKTSLSIGAQNTLSHTTNTYLATDYKPILTENNNYIYAKLGQNIGKVYLSLSTGMKLFWMKNDLSKRNFARNRSQFYGNWQISNSWNMAAAVSTNPTIPGLSDLTDYAQQQSQYLLSNGNPDLRTCTRWQYQIMPTYTYKKFAGSWMVSYSDRKNPYMSQIAYLGDGMFINQSINFEKQRSLTNSLSFRINGIAGFGARGNIDFDRYWTTVSGCNKSLNSLNGQVSIWWNKGPVTVSYTRKFPGKTLYGYVESRDENFDLLDVKYVPNDHWSISAGWWYMFDKKGTKYPSWSNSAAYTSTLDRYIKDNANMIVLSVSYSTNFGTFFNSGRRSLNNSDNGSSLLRN